MSKVEDVARAMEAKFKASVAASSGMAFEATGVTAPAFSVWAGYARAAIAAMRPDAADPDDPTWVEQVEVINAFIDAALTEPE